MLGGGIWLASRANTTDCIRFLQWPIIIIGLAVMVVSLMGFAGACYRQTWLLRIYLFAMFFIVVALLFFIVFAFAVTDRGEGQVVMNRRFLEYQLSDYNGWLRNRVADPEYWATISACLRDGRACASMRRAARDPNTGMLVPEPPNMFYGRDLSPIQVHPLSFSLPRFTSLLPRTLSPCDSWQFPSAKQVSSRKFGDFSCYKCSFFFVCVCGEFNSHLRVLMFSACFSIFL